MEFYIGGGSRGGNSDKEIDAVQLDHSYSKPWNWHPENCFVQPARRLLVPKPTGSITPQEEANQSVDVLRSVAENPQPPFLDWGKVRVTIPSESEKLLGVGEKDYKGLACGGAVSSLEGKAEETEDEDNWEDRIVQTDWSPSQVRLFSRVVEALHQDRLVRLAVHGQKSQPVRRRLSCESTAARIRRAFAQVRWDCHLCHWLHLALCRHLSRAYLALYLDALQLLRSRVPALVERSLMGSLLPPPTTPTSSAPIPTLIGASGPPSSEALQALLRKSPAEPPCPALTRPRKLPEAPVLVLLPCGPGMTWSQGSRRMRWWQQQMGAMAKVVAVPANSTSQVSRNSSVSAVLEQMMEGMRGKVSEVRRQYSGRPIVLVGWRVGSLLACHLSLVESVAGLVCLGPSLDSLHGKRGEADDVLYEIKTPTLFVIGQSACGVDQGDLEDLRERMWVDTSLVVVGGADDDLAVSKQRLHSAGWTQTVTDRCILEEIGDFLTSVLLHPPSMRPPPMRHTICSGLSLMDFGSSSAELSKAGRKAESQLAANARARGGGAAAARGKKARSSPSHALGSSGKRGRPSLTSFLGASLFSSAVSGSSRHLTTRADRAARHRRKQLEAPDGTLPIAKRGRPPRPPVLLPVPLKPAQKSVTPTLVLPAAKPPVLKPVCPVVPVTGVAQTAPPPMLVPQPVTPATPLIAAAPPLSSASVSIPKPGTLLMSLARGKPLLTAKPAPTSVSMSLTKPVPSPVITAAITKSSVTAVPVSATRSLPTTTVIVPVSKPVPMAPVIKPTSTAVTISVPKPSPATISLSVAKPSPTTVILPVTKPSPAIVAAAAAKPASQTALGPEPTTTFISKIKAVTPSLSMPKSTVSLMPIIKRVIPPVFKTKTLTSPVSVAEPGIPPVPVTTSVPVQVVVPKTTILQVPVTKSATPLVPELKSATTSIPFMTTTSSVAIPVPRPIPTPAPTMVPKPSAPPSSLPPLSTFSNFPSTSSTAPTLPAASKPRLVTSAVKVSLPSTSLRQPVVSLPKIMIGDQGSGRVIVSVITAGDARPSSANSKVVGPVEEQAIKSSAIVQSSEMKDTENEQEVRKQEPWKPCSETSKEESRPPATELETTKALPESVQPDVLETTTIRLKRILDEKSGELIEASASEPSLEGSELEMESTEEKSVHAENSQEKVLPKVQTMQSHFPQSSLVILPPAKPTASIPAQHKPRKQHPTPIEEVIDIESDSSEEKELRERKKREQKKFQRKRPHPRSMRTTTPDDSEVPKKRGKRPVSRPLSMWRRNVLKKVRMARKEGAEDNQRNKKQPKSVMAVGHRRNSRGESLGSLSRSEVEFKDEAVEEPEVVFEKEGTSQGEAEEEAMPGKEKSEEEGSSEDEKKQRDESQANKTTLVKKRLRHIEPVTPSVLSATRTRQIKQPNYYGIVS